MKQFLFVVILSLVIAVTGWAQTQSAVEKELKTTQTVVKAGDANFSGTWKLNLAKSQFSGLVYTFEMKTSGVWHYNGGGFDTDIDLAGKEYTMPSGIAVVGKELNPTSWELTFHMSGKVISKSRVTLNGDSLMWVSDITNPDGTTLQQSSTDARVSGGPGFAGQWKSGDVKGAPTTMQITVEGNEITIRVPEYQQIIKGNFDGKDNPVMQAGQATKVTNAFTKTGSNTIKITTKLNGKLFAEEVLTISADGTTITNDGTTTATNEKTKAVYDLCLP